MTTKKQPLAEIAAKIDAHLKRFASDPKTNPISPHHGQTRFGTPRATVAGAYVRVNYGYMRGVFPLTRDEAERYLAWIDAGNVGTCHDANIDPYEARRERASERARTREQARIKAEEERAAKVVFEPVTVEEAENFVEHWRAGSDVWRLAKTVLMHLRRAS